MFTRNGSLLKIILILNLILVKWIGGEMSVTENLMKTPTPALPAVQRLFVILP